MNLIPSERPSQRVSQTLKAVEFGVQHLCRRGKRGTFYIRRRIPSDIAGTFRPRGQGAKGVGRSEICISLRTSDAAVARSRMHAELAKLEADFARRRERLARMSAGGAAPHSGVHAAKVPMQPLPTLSNALLESLAATWLSSMLHCDEQQRCAGLDDEAFDVMGAELAATRADLGKLLARGHVEPILSAFKTLLSLHRFAPNLDDEELRSGAYRLLRTVVSGLDMRLQRQAGADVPTPAAPAALATTGAVASWDECLQAWQKRNPELSRETYFSMQTAWRSLRDFVQVQGVPSPGVVTRELVVAWAKHRRFTEKKSAKTVNEQRRKLRLIFQAAVGEGLVKTNPVTDIETFKVSKRAKATTRRLPFSNADLQTWFSHPVFTEHLRSAGQGGEATYWLPVLMFYTGARPEELAGLDVTDVRHSREHGHYVRITDLPDAEDALLSWNDDEDLASRRERVANALDIEEDKRGVKNPQSRRNMPLAAELIRLGFLDYVATVRAAGHKRLFPTLKPSCKGKVADAVLKALGRCLRDAGITDRRKTMYSFRHTMKMLLEEARVEPKVLKRILGHASGDGAITDGYGLDLPLGVVAEAMAKVKFPPIPAQPWRPGQGALRIAAKADTAQGTRLAHAASAVGDAGGGAAPLDRNAGQP